MLDSKTNNFSALGFPYPIYVVDVLDKNSLVVAGGGGAVKTGVPNRIDIVNLYRNEKNDPTPVDCQRSGGLDTGTEAVMSLTVITPGDGGYIASLEGQKCVEYIAHSKVNLVDSPLNSSSVETNVSSTDKTDEISLRRRKGESEKTDELNKAAISPEKNPVESSLSESIPLEWELTKIREYTLMQQAACSADDSGSESPSGSVPASLSGTPTCVAHGGPAGTWLAVGSDNGSVFLINRYSHQQGCLTNEQQLDDLSSQSLILYPDVSSGLSTGVCSMAFSHPHISSSSDSTTYPLLATICDRPDWSTLRVWRTDGRFSKSFLPLSDITSMRSSSVKGHQQIKSKISVSKQTLADGRGVRLKTFLKSVDTDAYDNSFKLQDQILFSHSVEKYPFAIASCSSLSCNSTPPPSPTPVSTASASGKVVDRSNYRFRHCQFMKYSITPQVPTGHTLSATNSKDEKSNNVESMLVTTLQPLCANRRSFSRLIVWSVPHASSLGSETTGTGRIHQPVQLNAFAEITLPQGHLPACLAVHPSRSRGLIAVGTMEGRVDVYFLSPCNHRLVNVYSLKNAHPIFVTALTFLRQDSSLSTQKFQKTNSKTHLKSDSFDLVSVSVDRLVKWHRGPTYSIVGKLSRGLIDMHNNDNNNWFRHIISAKVGISIIYFLSILMLPILLVLFEAILSKF
ncbi:unnamed protein product [Trichobilharzia szidati]|nr:unnamed protein product [Trichobilharzia szidati]